MYVYLCMYDYHIAVAIKPLALIKWCYVNSYGTRALTAMAGAMNEEFGRVLQIQMVLPFIHCQGTQYRQFIIYTVCVEGHISVLGP